MQDLIPFFSTEFLLTKVVSMNIRMLYLNAYNFEIAKQNYV